LKVLFLSEQIYPHASGAELATYLYAKLLSESGFNVRVITNKFSNESSFSQDGYVSIYRLPLYEKTGTVKFRVLGRVDALFSTFLNKMIKWADVVYVPRFWFSTIPLAKAHGKPVITHLHDYIPICPLATVFDSSKGLPCEGNRLICSPKCTYCYEKATTKRPFKELLASVTLNSTCRPLFSRLIELSDAIICVAKEQKDIISRSGFLASNKLSLVHNPVSNYSELPLKGDDFGYFGGLDKSKGFQTLYRSAVCLNAFSSRSFKIHSTKIPNVKKECADQLQKTGFCIYGKLEKKMYDEVYQKIRTVIVPSVWSEPWPYTIVEALLSGRYVIASRIGGIPEQVDTCKGVSLFTAGNDDELKTAMNYALNLDRATALELGFQNREAFRKRFSNEASLHQFINILENVA